MKEIWRDIPSYEGYYQASNMGRIRSIDRITRRNKNTSRKLKGKILKQLKETNGYLKVILSIGGKTKGHRVHRLVALAFIPNPENKEEVNHINEDKTDNRVCNLEWMTLKDNRNYGTRMERCMKNRDQRGCKNGMWGKKGILNKMSKRIIQMDLDGKELNIFNCVREAAESTKASPSQIARCANGFLNTTKGYKWKYVL